MRTLHLDWGDRILTISQRPKTEADRAIVLTEDGQELTPAETQGGRDIVEYLVNRNYWRTKEEAIAGGGPEAMPDRPTWAKQLLEQLFEAIFGWDGGGLDRAC